MSDESTVARALVVRPVVARLVLQRPELVPAEAGFYGWWSRRGAIERVPHVPNAVDDDLSLLYIGISPARATSSQTVRSRIIGNHLHGNVGSSTFRFVLAALLMPMLGLHPFLRGKHVTLDATDNERLSMWQREHLLLTWQARERPWEIEHGVIAQLGPPLNSAGNAGHPFYPHIRAARAEFRHRAAQPPLTPML